MLRSIKSLHFMVLSFIALTACDSGSLAKSCGEGTELEGRTCLPTVDANLDAGPICGAGTHFEGGACVPEADSVTCGADTHLEEGACVPNAAMVVCGPGTERVAGACVPESTVVCGSDTHLEGETCVPDGPGLACGDGTHLEDEVCVPDEPELSCGPDTHLEGEICLPDFECGPDTHLDDGLCVADFECGPGARVEGERCIPEFVCGVGAHIEDDACVPDVACGEGTRVEDGNCVPEVDLVCGAGTQAVEGVCLADIRECGDGAHQDGAACAPDVACGADTVARGGLCFPAETQQVIWPLVAGEQVQIIQGHHANFTHTAANVWAVDFAVPEGTTVVAARAGVVQRVREDSNIGCADERCRNDGNYVILDHGDGTLGLYWHLQQNGALVEAGDVVCAGQPIGLSGNTGLSTRPHLHFEVQDFLSQSLPLRFAGLEASSGIAFVGLEAVSDSEAPEICEIELVATHCSPELFAHMGVRLDGELPCTVATRDTAYPIEGQVLAPTQRLMVARWSAVANLWNYQCFPTEPDGSFAVNVDYPSAAHGGYSYLMIAAAPAEGGCTSLQAWDASVFLSLEAAAQ